MTSFLPRRVAVTGLGAISPLGVGYRASWQNLLAKKCGIRRIGPEHGDFSKHNECRVAGLVPLGPSASSGGWDASEHLSRDERRKLSLFMQYAVTAAHEALADAKWQPQSDHDRDATGVCIGSGIGAFTDIYETSLAFDRGGPKKVSPYFVPRLLVNLAAGHVSMRHGLRGPNHAATTACTTGAHSVGDAARFIQCGDADVMLAGGAESCIHPLAFVGFERSRSLTTSSNEAPERASRPFSEGRDGFVIGEGAAMLVLEELGHALKRGATIYALLDGYGASADANHITQPPQDGNGALRAMKRALQSAGKRPSDVDYVNAHATSTPLGDIAEARAIADLIESDTGRSGHGSAGLRVSSTKGATGHLLGAAGAVEALFSVLAIHENRLPGTLNLDSLDPALPKLRYHFEQREEDVETVLSNSFGFGGTNASLCFTKYRS